DDERLVPPEQAVMDEHELGPCPARALEQVERRGDAAGDARYLVAADDLQPGGPELLPLAHVHKLLGEPPHVVPPCHMPTQPRPPSPGHVPRRGHLASVDDVNAGEPWVPPRQSGCPDLNWGPLRPERSALPGCATPRACTG